MMRSRQFLGKLAQVAVFLALGPVFSVPAFAQLKPEGQTGTLFQARPQAVDQQEAGFVRKEFAQCVYKRSKAKAAALLAHSDIASVDRYAAGITDLNKDLHMDTCLGQSIHGSQMGLSMRFTTDVLRDLMAEESYLASYRRIPSVGPLQPIAIDTKTTSEAQALASFTDCAVRSDLAGADGLLRTVPGSVQERQAAGRLAPALGACLATGQRLVLKPENIRALLAYAMWTRFVSPAAAMNAKTSGSR